MNTSVAQRLISSSPKLEEALEIVKTEVGRLTKTEEQARELFTQALGIGIKRPVNWSSRSNAAYYNEKFGKILLKWLTELEKQPDKDFLLESRKLHKSRESIVQQISQSWMWLINNAKSQEEADKLTDLRSSIFVKRVMEGVILTRKREINPEELLGKFVTAYAIKTSKWKGELLEFIDTATDGQSYVAVNVMLEPYDIAWIKAHIEALQGVFIRKIGTTCLEVVKHMELWKKMQEPRQ